MNYEAFKTAAAKFTVAELRCDVPPSDDLIDFMETVGLKRYERFVLRFVAESKL